MTDPAEIEAAANRILNKINVNKVRDIKHMRMIFKRDHRVSVKQDVILDKMIDTVFPGKQKYHKSKAGMPIIQTGNYVPPEYYRPIELKKTGQVIRQTKCDIIIGGKKYRKGMFIPIYKEKVLG